MLDDTALWRELKSFKGDWDRWSIEERLVAAVPHLYRRCRPQSC